MAQDLIVPSARIQSARLTADTVVFTLADGSEVSFNVSEEQGEAYHDIMSDWYMELANEGQDLADETGNEEEGETL